MSDRCGKSVIIRQYSFLMLEHTNSTVSAQFSTFLAKISKTTTIHNIQNTDTDTDCAMVVYVYVTVSTVPRVMLGTHHRIIGPILALPTILSNICPNYLDGSADFIRCSLGVRCVKSDHTL